MALVSKRCGWLIVGLMVGMFSLVAGPGLGAENPSSLDPAEEPGAEPNEVAALARDTDSVDAQGETPSDAAEESRQKTRGPGLAPFMRASYQVGHVLKTNPFVEGNNQKGEPIDTYQAARLEFGWQTDGSSLWHHVYNFPSYGFGVYGADFFNDQELGQPTALYGFFSWPLKRWSRTSLNTEIGFGLTENWVPYHPETNPDNVAMGGAKSVYIDAGFTLDYELSKRFDLLGGFTFTHFSNGGSKAPNSGINQVGPYALVRYHIRKFRPTFPERVIPPYHRQWELFVYGAGASKQARSRADPSTPEGQQQLEKYYGKDYFVGNVTASFVRQLGYKFKAGFGMDAWYDGSTEARMEIGGNLDDVQLDFAENLNLGVHYVMEVVANRVSAPLVVGYSVWRKEFDGQDPRLYQKAGIKWHIWENTFVGLNVRAVDFSRAVFLEWFLGHRWRWD
jgi:hypothetical protein